VCNLSSYVTNRQELSAQVALFIRHRMSSYTWVVHNTTITQDEVYQMMKEGDDIGYGALKSRHIQCIKKILGTQVTLTCEYNEDIVQMQYVQNHLPRIVAPIMRKYQSSHARVLQFHDWVVHNFRYDKSLTYHSAYAGIVHGRTVCNGYSMMFAYLCREADIPCQIAVGKVHRRGLHAWNMVQLDGAWYHVDTTWDSPVSDLNDAYVPYGFYMLTDSEMAMTRKVGMQVRGKKTPTATTMYATVLQQLCDNAHPHTSELEQIRRSTGLIYTEPRNTIADRKSLLTWVVGCMQSGLTQATIRYTALTLFVSSDLKWVRARLQVLYAPQAKRIQLTYQSYYRAGSEHSLVMLHFS
jgi:hypothetical protein